MINKPSSWIGLYIYNDGFGKYVTRIPKNKTDAPIYKEDKYYIYLYDDCEINKSYIDTSLVYGLK